MVNCKLYGWERVFMWNIRRELISGGFTKFTGGNTDQKWFKKLFAFPGTSDTKYSRFH